MEEGGREERGREGERETSYPCQLTGAADYTITQ